VRAFVVEPDAFGERLKALFARGSHHVAFVPDDLATPLAEAVTVHDAAVVPSNSRRSNFVSNVFRATKRRHYHSHRCTRMNIGHRGTLSVDSKRCPNTASVCASRISRKS